MVIESASERFEAGPGEFIEVPAGVIHRESNPGAEESIAVVARGGDGQVTVNCGAPTP